MLKRKARSAASLRYRGERGQTLVLFVAVFTVILGLSAFAIDQGVYLSKRRQAQKDADTAARAGAMAYLADPSAGAAADADAKDRAADTAEANLVEVTGASNPDFDTSGNCSAFGDTLVCTEPDCETFKVDFDASHSDAVYEDVPAVHVEINKPTNALFGRVLGNVGAPDLGAQATACVGEPSQAQGIDPFFIAPDADRPDPLCFDGSGNPSFGTICAIMGPSHFHDVGQRGSLTLQDDASEDPLPNNQTLCTEPNASNQPGEIVEGSGALCTVGDEVHTDGGTFQNVDAEIRCRIMGYDDVGNDCPNGWRSTAKAPGEGFCDSAYSQSGTTIPPTPGSWDPDDYDPDFLPADVINSPAGVDDFEEVFSKPDGSPPDSLEDTEFLIPNICANGKQSPRIFTIVLAEETASQTGGCVQINANGCVVVKEFAMFYVIGCRNVDGPGSTTFVGRIDPFCDGKRPDTYQPSINGARTALVGIFVKALLPSGGGPLEPCEPGAEGLTCSIVLVK